MTLRIVATWALGLCALLAAHGCKDPEPRTQVMLVVDADKALRDRITGLTLEVEGFTAGPSDTRQEVTSFRETYQPIDRKLGGWPHRFAVAPLDGDAERSYAAEVRALGADGEIALVRANSSFVEGKTLELRLRFEVACETKSLSCPASQTCKGGECTSATVSPRRLPDLGSSSPGRDAGPDTLVDASSGSTMSPQLGVDGSAASDGAAGEDAAGTGGGGAGGGAGMSAPEPGCGDGELNGEERCDTAIPSGQPGACPVSCPSEDACNPRRLEGSGCAQRCVAAPEITTPVPQDGCCPAGAGANTDSDCSRECGNGMIEGGETCDPIDSCPTTDTCKSSNACLKPVVMGSASTCTAVCVSEPVTECAAGDGCCPAGCTRTSDGDCSSTCGDGVVDIAAGETCEPGSSMPCLTTCDDMNACTADALTGSAGNCNTSCTHTPITTPLGGDRCCPPGASSNTDSDCTPVCGNDVVELGERCDGNCPTSAADCNDNVSCTSDMLMGSACGRECVRAPVQASTGARDMCCPTGANASTDSDCAAVCGNNVIEVGERCDGNCPTSATDCNDDMACTTDSVSGASCSRQCAHTPITVPMTAPDGCCPTGATSANDGDCATRCGNMIMEAGEQCDDGNTTAGDGCSATCQIDNNTMTPGDERRGFVACGVVGMPSTMTCAMDQQCCNTAAMGGTPTYACVASGGTCTNRHACDGPEDCGTSEVCCLTSTPADGETTSCVARADCTGTVQVCHTQSSAMCPL